MTRIVFASDHGAFELKNDLILYLKSKHNLECIDCGVHDASSVDYPDYADKVVQTILDQQADLGILCCGTGIGISIRANRYKGIRAALVYDDFTAEMAKAHNNANILCFGGRTTTLADAKQYVDKWLSTPYEGGRHQRRLDKLDQ
jgi:ribose 5-phosphate isomerase B